MFGQHQSGENVFISEQTDELKWLIIFHGELTGHFGQILEIMLYTISHSEYVLGMAISYYQINI